MARMILYFLLVACLCLSVCNKNGHDESILTLPAQSVAFSGPSMAFVVTEKGELLRTQNGGAGWDKLSAVGVGRFYRVAFLDPNRGWAINERREVWRTNDKGETWNLIAKLAYNNELFVGPAAHMQIVDGLHGYVLDPFSIWRTEDGGANWRRFFPMGGRKEANHTLSHLYFLNPEKGFICGTNGAFRYTEDGGKTWQGQNISVGDNTFGDMFFSNASTGWVCTWPTGRIYRTDNGGQTWRQQQIPAKDIRIDSIHFINNTEGWAASTQLDGSSSDDNIRGILLHTNDGGQNWQILHTGEKGSFYKSVYFADAQQGWLLSHDKTKDNIYRTEDGGKSWRIALSLPQKD